MISLLSQIVSQFICWVETALVFVLNGVILALAAIVGVVTGLMPDIPSAPSLPGPLTTALSWIAWFFPVGTLIDVLAFLLAAWLIWIGVATVLRWVKVVE